MEIQGVATLSLEVQGGRSFQLLPVAEPIPSGVVTENTRVVFRLLLTDPAINIFQVELAVDEIPLERVTMSLTEARWGWDPGFYAGLAILQLTGLPGNPILFELLTDPARAKLTREEFDHMVGDILEDSLSLIALSGLRVGVSRGDGEALDLARFEFLRSCLGRIEEAVREIDAAPWMRLERTPIRLPLGRSGGATSRELSGAAREAVGLSPAELAALPPAARELADALGGRLPRVVGRALARPDYHRREHADMLAALRRWRGFLVRVRQGLERVERQSPAQARARIMRRHCGRMIVRLDRLEALPLFVGVEPTRGPLSPSHLFRRVAPYQRFFAAYRDFMTGIGDIHGDFLKLPLQRTYELYELWCFLRLVRAAALDETPVVDWHTAFSERPDRSGLVMSLRTKPFRFKGFTLVFQPEYHEVWRTGAGRVGSFSRTMIPDLVLELGGDEARPIVVLDAKYRVDTMIDEAIVSIHTYRDALVEAVQDEGYLRTVRAAFLLTPHVPGEEPADWRTDSLPEVFFRDGYRQTFRFGAITLRPGVSLEQCQDLLRTIVSLSGAVAS